MIENYDEIQGWFGYEKHFDELIELAQKRMSDNGAAGDKKPFPVVVEVGAWLGRSSFYLVEKHNTVAKIYVVDTWNGSQNELDTFHALVKERDIYIDFMKNMEKWHGKFTPVRTTSVSAAGMFDNGSVDFVFIDAEHTDAAVTADIAAWLPKLSPSGIIAGHDYHWEGVKAAVDRVFRPEGIRIDDVTWIIESPHESKIIYSGDMPNNSF